MNPGPAAANTEPALTEPTGADGQPLPKPFIPPEQVIPESTLSALAVGSILGILFAASSVYLGLKVGLTVSASIPIAVMSITIFRALRRSRHPHILENNIVQTTGSAGESIAAGVAFTLPSLLVMGFDLELMRVLLVALLGGTLGVLMMIPLRHGLIVKEHGRLAYPEGTACAQVLIAGEKGGTSARTVFQGFFVGLGYGILNLLLRLWAEVSTVTSAALGLGRSFTNASLSAEVSPPLLGVGYIIGLGTAAHMMAGGMLAFVVLIPLISHFGAAIPGPFGPGITKPIAAMTPGDIRNSYLLYIGAGAVATGGFISLLRSLPTIVAAFRRGLSSISGGARGAVPRTERDLSYSWVIWGSLALVIAIAVAPQLQINPLAAALIVLFGFFFTTVSSRVTGEIGSSSNPISGMTVATLLITCLVFLALGWVGVSYKAMALTTAALVCVAASNGGTTSQDLKTGFLVGGTPYKQQTAILVGVLTSSLVIGWTLLSLDRSASVYVPRERTLAGLTVDPALLASAPEETYPPGSASRYRVVHVVETRAGSGSTRLVPAGDGQAGQVLLRAEGEPRPGLVRGRYLVEEQGRIAYLVDPGVCGTETRRMYPVPAEHQAPAPPPAAGAAAATTTYDGVPYREVTLEQPLGSLKAGHYLADAATGQLVYETQQVAKFDAPKARLFALIIDGILGGELPWTLVLVGVMTSLLLELVKVSSLPFAVGLYLPISTSTPIFIGGLLRAFVDRRAKLSGPEAESSPGVLFASGLIAGGAIAGLVKAAEQGTIADGPNRDLFAWGPRYLGHLSESSLLALVPFALMAYALVQVGLSARRGDRPVGQSGG